MSERRVLVTGASGLIGGWLRRAWSPDAGRLLALSSADADLLADGEVARVVREHAPTDVVHLAWSSNSRPGYRDSPDNARWCEATLTLADHAAGGAFRLWLTGSVLDRSEQAADAYTGAKRRLRDALSGALAEGEVGWLRPFYVVDPDGRRPGVVAAALDAADSGTRVRLREPHQRHDFVHAADVGAGIATAVARDRRGELDLGSGALHSVRELVSALGVESEPAGEMVPEPAGDEAADVRWLTEHGWTPSYTLDLFTPREGRT